MKRILSMFLIFCMFIQLYGINGVLALDVNVDSGFVTTQPEPCGENAFWHLDKGVLTISGSGDMDNYDYNYDRQPWLQYASQVSTIIIEDGITSIGQIAFSSGSAYLDGEHAIFSNLTDVQVAETVTKIYDNAFVDCFALESFHIPVGVEYIGERVFSGCSRLKEIKVDVDNDFYCDIGGVLFSKDGTNLLNYPIGSPATEYTIPSSTKILEDHSFTCAENLEKVNFNEGLERINDEVFNSCYKLKEAILPNGLKHIGAGAFQDCTNFEYVFIPDSVEHVGGVAFLETAFAKDEKNWSYGTGLYANGILLDARYNSFYGYEESDFIGDHYSVAPGTRLIAQEAFFLTNLKSVEIPEGVEYICDGAFESTDLESVDLPESLIVLEDSVFNGCSHLESVSLGSNIQKIGSGVFNETPFAQNSDFYENGILYYDNYLLDFDRDWEYDFEIKEGITLMAEGAFFNESGKISENYGSSLTNVTFPKSLTAISKFAFLDCEKLNRVEIPATITEIGDYAFGYLYNYNHDLDEEYYTLKPNFTIVCGPDSAAETYAISNGINFEHFAPPTIKAEAIDITSNETLFAYNGYTPTSFYLSVSFSPLDAEPESLNWVSTNESVATVDKTGKVTLRNVGTATIIVSSESGLTDTITATVAEIPYITTETPLDISFSKDIVIRRGLFVPNETAEYTLSFNEGTTKIDVYEGNTRVANGSGNINVTMTEGVEYSIKISRKSDYVNGGTLSIVKTPSEDNTDTPVEVVGLKLTPPNKRTYYIGDFFDMEGLKVELVYNDGSTQSTNDYIIEGFDPYSEGAQIIRVSCMGFVATFTVRVKEQDSEPAIIGISILTPPDKTEYYEGELLNVSGGSINLIYDDGSTTNLPLTLDMVSEFDSYRVGSQNLTITYENFTTQLTITVRPKYVTAIVMNTLPHKLTYVEGENSLSLEGGKITAYFNSGDIRVVNLTPEMISGFNNLKIGKQTLTVTYGNCKTTFAITMKAKSITGISVDTLPTKTTYYQGDSLDTRGMVVKAKYNNGSTSIVTGWKASASLKSVGKNSVTVTYNGHKTTFNVTVKTLETPNLKVTGQYFKYKLSWNKISGAQKYTIYYRLYKKGKWSDWKSLISTAGDITDYTHVVAVEDDDRYQYSVISVNGSVKTDRSNVVKVLPNPQNVKLTSSNSGLNLSWSKVKSVDGKKTAEKYDIYRRLSGGKWKKLKTVTSTKYVDKTVKSKKEYQYKVNAVCKDYVGYHSSSCEARWLKTPVSIKATKSKKSFKISWSKVTGASQYELQRRVGSGSWKTVKTTTSTKFTDSNLKKGKSYTYRVRAVSGSNSKSQFKTGKKTKL